MEVLTLRDDRTFGELLGASRVEKELVKFTPKAAVTFPSFQVQTCKDPGHACLGASWNNNNNLTHVDRAEGCSLLRVTLRFELGKHMEMRGDAKDS